MKHLHSTVAVVLLIALLVSIVLTLVNYLKYRPYNRKIALIGLISGHIQMLIGITYFITLQYYSMFSGAVMKDSLLRFKIIEHPLMMLLGVVAITIGYSKAKRMTDDWKANQTVFIFYLVGLVFFLSRIPWSTWSLFA
ncbi:hypothetical protein ACFSQ3_00480 [Sphingobacterium corticis]|uniref:Cytochrome B n=1 Tax=Sphingobacterium corticis TaxID=1812823 RepID=A0ABW5NDZ4_9SPHI